MKEGQEGARRDGSKGTRIKGMGGVLDTLIKKKLMS